VDGHFSSNGNCQPDASACLTLVAVAKEAIQSRSASFRADGLKAINVHQKDQWEDD
jgi:hypothetical protein